MYNAKNIYNIVFNKPYNPNKTYFQNANRNTAIKVVKGFENVQNAVNEIMTKGYTIRHIYNGMGEFITL